MNIQLHRPRTDGERLTHRILMNGREFSMTLDTNKPTQRYISDFIRNGMAYEVESTTAIAAALDEGDMFFDVGANCGWFSAVARAFGADVMAFEPDQENCDALRLNAPGAQVIEAVVTDFTGPHILYTNLDNDGGHSIWPCAEHPWNTATRDAGSPTQVVPCVRLDDYAPLRPKVIKIDTEGAECNVLLGAENVLSHPSLRMVVCERHQMGLGMLGHSAEEIEGIMRRHGFTWDTPETDGLVHNWIFTR